MCSTRMRNVVLKRLPHFEFVEGDVGAGAEAQADPVRLYLLSVAPGSRRALRQALDTVADVVSPGATADTFQWPSLTYAKLVEVRAELATRYAPATTKKILAAVRGTLKQAMLLDQIEPAQYAKCTAVRAFRGSAVCAGRSITQGDLAAMFAACDSRPLGQRDCAMLSLLYGCGLRRSEVVSLELDDYDPTVRTLRIVGKGSKARVAYLTETTTAAIERWLELRGRAAGPIFVRITQAGGLTSRRLSAQAVYRLTARAARRSGVERPSPHDFRRAFVSDLLDRGADLSVVQQLVGHASPTTTSRYDHRGDRARRSAAELLSIPAPDAAA